MKRSIIIFLLFFVAQVIGAIITLAMGVSTGVNADFATVMANMDPVAIGIGVGVAELLLIAVLWRWFSHPGAFRFAGTTCSGKGLLAILGFMVMAIGLDAMLSFVELNDLGMEEKFASMKDNWFCLLSLCVIGPLAEEMTFREGILREMMAAGARPWAAIVSSAVAFGMVHGDPAQMVPAVVMGAALGWMYYKTGNLSLCLPAHILNNSFACATMNCPEIDGFIEGLSPFVVVPVGAVLCLVGAFLMYRCLRSASTLSENE